MQVNYTEIRFTSRDGTELYSQSWKPKVKRVKATLLVVPGYADHAGRYRELAHALAAQAIGTTALDLRGHGRSAGLRGFVNDFAEYHADVDAALTNLEDHKPFILGHSNGGLVVLDRIAQGLPYSQFRGLIVVNPFLALVQKVPALKNWLGRAAGAFLPTLSVPSGINPKDLSHDETITDAYARDPLVFKTTTAGWFREALLAQRRVLGLSEINSPIVFVLSSGDKLASFPVSQSLAEQVSSPDKSVWQRPEEFHEVLNETNRTELYKQIANWILARAES